MTQKTNNTVWSFLASVKLALFLLFALAAFSIIGTLIPQGESFGVYVQKYGPNMARFMRAANIFDMYNSWWFISLLGMFSLNLMVCSLERIPNAWRLVTMDNLATNPERLKKMGIRKEFEVGSSLGDATEKAASFLAGKGWKTSKKDIGNATMLFSQKGGWTRFGVYIVHISILVILIGAIIGSPGIAKLLKNPTYAFKGSVMLPETQQTDHIYTYAGTKIPLGFTVRCDYFTIDYYDNGMPKEFLSKLTVLENGEEVLKTDIEVNEPLIYNGITFYQSSYQPYQDFVISLKNDSTGVNKTSIVPSREQTSWKEEGVRFGIINMMMRGEAVDRLKIWFTDDKGEPSIFWLEPGREATIKRSETSYTISTKQLYATGLQVVKDPGVWWVYTGCGLMLIGLVVAFFMSHRKIWALIYENEGKITVLFSGSAHKNKLGFEKTFTSMLKDFQ